MKDSTSTTHGNTVAIIPARGGSKGLPGKNTRHLHGKPMIAYTVEAALQADGIDDVIVTTDDQSILNAAMTAGATYFPLRPYEISNDTATTLDVLQWLADVYPNEKNGQKIDHCVLLQPTSPLRTATHISEALAQYRHYLKKANTIPTTVVSMTSSKPLAWQGYTDNHGYWQAADKALATRRQDAQPLLGLNGAIYIGQANHVFEYGFLQGCHVVPYEMNANVAVDVDTIDDFRLIEALMSLKKTKIINQ